MPKTRTDRPRPTARATDDHEPDAAAPEDHDHDGTTPAGQGPTTNAASKPDAATTATDRRARDAGRGAAPIRRLHGSSSPVSRFLALRSFH